MSLKKNTILITGGTSGLGLEMARKFVSNDNIVIVCSRTTEKLNKTKNEIPNVITYKCDISKKDDRAQLKKWILENHPSLNILINNAAIVHKINLISDDNFFDSLISEVDTNLIAPIDLINLLLPVISKNSNSKIINITTGLIYAPRIIYPYYNATKSALHSYTKVLRAQLNNKSTKVIEVMFPAVNTPWHMGNPPSIAISPEKAIDEMMKCLIKEKEEIKIGGVKILYILSRIAPKFAFKKINSIK